jgi:aryl-alcohol dehydrogenase-like predicted oxidoreductase
MEYALLGKTDLKVSRIGLGAMQFGPAWIKEKEVMVGILNYALDNGVTFIDTAEVYGKHMSETVIGEVLRDRGDRDDFVIATKVHPLNLRHDDVLKAAEGSLKRLQTDVIDLYQVHHHHPYCAASGTMKALDKLLQDGKVRYVGVSNFSVSLLEEVIPLLKNGQIVSNQVEYSLLYRNIESEILPFQRKNGIATIAYSPLAMGILTGKYDETTELPETDFRRTDPLFNNKENLGEVQKVIGVMKEIADSHDATVPAVALNWLLRSEDMYPIPGAKNVDHVKSNISASEWKLSDDEWERITTASDDLDLNTFADIGKF